jgi:hypothetical protein
VQYVRRRKFGEEPAANNTFDMRRHSAVDMNNEGNLVQSPVRMRLETEPNEDYLNPHTALTMAMDESSRSNILTVASKHQINVTLPLSTNFYKLK